jgi:hypothetical protein
MNSVLNFDHSSRHPVFGIFAPDEVFEPAVPGHVDVTHHPSDRARRKLSFSYACHATTPLNWVRIELQIN